MFESIRSALSTGPDTIWISEVVDAGYVVDSRLEPVQYEQKEDYSHTWELGLREPARDGNDIAHLNFRNEDGQIVSQLELLSGEESTRMQMTPEAGEMEIVAVSTGDEVRDTSRVKIREEPLTD